MVPPPWESLRLADFLRPAESQYVKSRSTLKLGSPRDPEKLQWEVVAGPDVLINKIPIVLSP
jgi:hypothetical protein